METELKEIYREIDKIIASYKTDSFRIKSSGNTYEKKYAEDVNNCMMKKVTAIKDGYAKLKKEIQYFETSLNKLMNFVSKSSEIQFQIDCHHSSIESIRKKIDDIDSELGENEKKIDKINEKINSLISGNYCRKNLDIVNTLSEKKYNCYYDSREICDRYGQIIDVFTDYEIEEIKSKIFYKIANCPEMNSNYEKYVLELKGIEKRNKKINLYRVSYYNLIKLDIAYLEKLKEEKTEIRAEIYKLRTELIDFIYDSCSRKTVEILSNSILVSSKFNFDLSVSVSTKIKYWINCLVMGGNNE